MQTDLVLIRREGAIARLTLNDPGRANVLSGPMIAALDAALGQVDGDDAVRVIVLGAAGRIFCAGHDLAELRAADQSGARALFGACSTLMMRIAGFRAPVIAQVQGAAVAAGCQLVASCDLAYAADTARFAVSGIDLGLFCSTPGVALARAIGRKAAHEMLMTGRFVPASEARELGLINRSVPAQDLDGVVDDVARTIASKASDAMALGKSTFRQQIEAPESEAYGMAARAMVDNLALESARSGIDAFLARQRLTRPRT